ncbi:NADPH-dependent FMN reductase [Bacillus paramycoides]|uniref:NADPH-dependent FMN reductase n=1 Tax=Bacillus paramycoides TaxID=2026194 RepID=UPI002E1DD94D|nr:NAD(P)H-dependent oxidoreductase [Bacillus paramycoides]MED0982110.1 NAD(P)H-dependent oxidoreductase [Bacillus paramycoides]MED0984422.1 NAD(P)H-dependent oxidoreductase [Bacillus paramycoides]MED1103405.1 NAD(P)H-dependent oxidoreductase [Bacillus paramycoides]
MSKHKKIIAISGSIREGSSNTNILKALAAFIPDGVDYTIYKGIEELPHFNPDVDRVGAPVVVEEFRKTLSESHALIICTPEYAKGIPGVLKNALEWLVSSAELYKKPVAIITASPSITGGDKAHESLLLTLGMIDTVVVQNGSVLIPSVRTKFSDDAKVTDEDTKQALISLIQSIVDEIRE